MHTWREAVLGCAQPPADDGNLALEYYLVEQQIGEDKTWHALKVASDSPAALGQRLGQTDVAVSRSGLALIHLCCLCR